MVVDTIMASNRCDGKQFTFDIHECLKRDLLLFGRSCWYIGSTLRKSHKSKVKSPSRSKHLGRTVPESQYTHKHPVLSRERGAGATSGLLKCTSGGGHSMHRIGVISPPPPSWCSQGRGLEHFVMAHRAWEERNVVSGSVIYCPSSIFLVHLSTSSNSFCLPVSFST